MGVHLFGLTGGIACGKSSIATHLRRRKVPVIDADELARTVVAPGTEGLAAIVAAFGEGILQEGGEEGGEEDSGERGAEGPDGGAKGPTLDRKALARLAFSDPVARARLNSILHPRIARLTSERAAQLGAAGAPLACYEAALIVENGLADKFRPLVVVACPEDAQVARLQARDGMSEAEALARIRAQAPLPDKIAAADFVIDSTVSREETLRRADEVLDAICARLGVDVARYPSSR
jgi:dephospho-CoA kinase